MATLEPLLSRMFRVRVLKKKLKQLLVFSQKKNSTVSKFRSQDIDTWLSFFVAFTWILDALGILPDQEKTLNRKFLQQEWGQSLGM